LTLLNERQCAALLRVARDAIVRHVHGDPPLAYAEDLPDASGVFVTIKRKRELRGCLGVLQMRGPLAEEVARCARDSATHDPRFPPMTPGELAGISLDISILGPLEELDPFDVDAIEIGRHGLVVEEGWRRGLLLPQVAVEWGWTREQFLRQTCRKAMLAEDAWRTGARVSRFTAQVFGEENERGSV
jgi:AmmeMemoRadiSam system protein A